MYHIMPQGSPIQRGSHPCLEASNKYQIFVFLIDESKVRETKVFITMVDDVKHCVFQ